MILRQFGQIPSVGRTDVSVAIPVRVALAPEVAPDGDGLWPAEKDWTWYLTAGLVVVAGALLIDTFRRRE